MACDVFNRGEYGRCKEDDYDGGRMHTRFVPIGKAVMDDMT